MSELFSIQQGLIPFVTLAALEIVLGVDNVVFIAILSDKLPEHQRALARQLGLGLAALGRAILLFAIAWVITLEATQLFTVPWLDMEITAKDLILVLGGLFLLGKATWEIHHNLEGEHAAERDASGAEGGADRKAGASARHVGAQVGASFGMVIGQILMLDLVFSIDSVLTAVGMVRPDDYTGVAHFPLTTIPWVPLVIMIAAIVAAIAVMLIFIGPISRFIRRHPTMKMLALSFLLLVGVILIAEGLGQHIDRRYIYFAMGFSLFVELLNLRIVARRRRAAGS